MNSISNSSDKREFSYAEYRFILQELSKRLEIIDYADISENTENFCVIRHDIEFSIERALVMAKIESEMNVKTSYFFQITNNTYNIFSSENIAIVCKIASLGHKIGLHFSPSSDDEDQVKKEFFRMKKVFEEMLPVKLDRFSFHRPNLNSNILSKNIKIDGIINVYSDLFFEYFDDEIPGDPRVKYISDSNHQWKYGHPLDITDNSWKKVHVLIHPFSWSVDGGGNFDNYLGLLAEKNNRLLESIDNEISNFPIDEIKRYQSKKI